MLPLKNSDTIPILEYIWSLEFGLGIVGLIIFYKRCISICLALLLLLSHFSRVNSVWPHRQQPTRLPHPWDSPGKNTGVGCHFLLQCMKVKSEREVSQSCPTLRDPMDCSLLGSSVHGIFQARVLEWVAIAFSGLALLCHMIYIREFVA